MGKHASQLRFVVTNIVTDIKAAKHVAACGSVKFGTGSQVAKLIACNVKVDPMTSKSLPTSAGPWPDGSAVGADSWSNPASEQSEPTCLDVSDDVCVLIVVSGRGRAGLAA